VLNKAYASGMFMYIDPDLKIDQLQTNVVLDRDKAAELGLNMQDIGNVLGAAVSQGYINYFDYDGRSYQVIPQMKRQARINPGDLLNYYITAADGTAVPLGTIASLKRLVVPESINHFQQLNSSTISAIAMPGISMGEALSTFKTITDEVLP